VSPGPELPIDGAEDPAEPERKRLYDDFADASLAPLWTQRDDLMPAFPTPRAVAHRWSWAEVVGLARRAGQLVPVGRGGERRAIALANPGLPGRPFATATLWAAVQYLGAGETAPAHRHSQNAFRFVVDGEGVWTVVDGDAVAMRRGDLLLTPGWAWHSHHNPGATPMVWLDGLDIPFVGAVDAEFFEYGPETPDDPSTPARSRSERLWAHPGLRPLSALDEQPTSPLVAYRWHHTDAALDAQLELDANGRPGVVEPGHAAVRFVNPTTGGDALATLRTEMHRLRAGTRTAFRREVGSSVWQVFSGSGALDVGNETLPVGHGDLVAVPSWCPMRIVAGDGGVDLFRFGDASVVERLGLAPGPPSP
jgi:gentisate 1,2-dioxygenase